MVGPHASVLRIDGPPLIDDQADHLDNDNPADDDIDGDDLLNSSEFEIDAKDLLVGNYDIVIDGIVRGTLPVFQDGNDTEGEVEFETFPDKAEELLLDFDVIGLPIEISLNRVVYFSGTVPTPPDAPTGDDGDGGDDNGTPGPNDPVNNGLSPDSIDSLSWTLNDGGTLERLDFLSSIAGQEVDLDSNDIDSFSYTYQKDSDPTATLIATFDTDKWDEYTLDFSNGAFVRREFKDGAVDDTDSGTFIQN